MDERLADRFVCAGAAVLGAAFLGAAIGRLTAPVGVTITAPVVANVSAAPIAPPAPIVAAARSKRSAASPSRVARRPPRATAHRNLPEPRAPAPATARRAPNRDVATYAVPTRVISER